MNTIDLLFDDALDVVSGGLAVNAATAPPGKFAPGKLPPLPDSSPGTQGEGGGYGGWWAAGVAAAIIVVI